MRHTICFGILLYLLDAHKPVQIARRSHHLLLTAVESPLTEVKTLSLLIGQHLHDLIVRAGADVRHVAVNSEE